MTDSLRKSPYGLVALATVIFDIDSGQRLDALYPTHGALSEDGKQSVAHLALPHSNKQDEGDTQFIIRFRSERSCVKPTTSFEGAILFKFRDVNCQNESTYLVEISKSKEVTTRKDVSASDARSLTCEVTISVDDFLWIYSGKASSSDVLKLFYAGRLSISGYAFRKVSTFAQSFDYSSERWRDFYAWREEEANMRHQELSHFLYPYNKRRHFFSMELARPTQDKAGVLFDFFDDAYLDAVKLSAKQRHLRGKSKNRVDLADASMEQLDRLLKALGRDGHKDIACGAQVFDIDFHPAQDIVAVGNITGVVQVYKYSEERNSKLLELNHHQDSCRALLFSPDGQCDGRLSAYDLRKNVLAGKSDELDDELLSVSVIKNGRKVVCGSQDGVLVIFSWGTWGDMSDRFPGHPESVESILKIDEDTVLTGSSDGIVRVVQVHPNKLLGLIGDHEDFPIEILKLSHDQRLIGSVSHTNKVHFWDVGYLFNDDGEDGDENEGENDEEMKDADSDDDSDAEANTFQGRRAMPTAREAFFSDL
ncbi:hypothetical protein ATCC90586_008913 [Pythium insidiosum]|nr:hypothetical protein ATCC90586_008913 [Pythium insidiosum]